MATDRELRQATIKAVMLALMRALAMPSGKSSLRGPEKINAAQEMLKVSVTTPTTMPANRSVARLREPVGCTSGGSAAAAESGRRVAARADPSLDDCASSSRSRRFRS